MPDLRPLTTGVAVRSALLALLGAYCAQAILSQNALPRPPQEQTPPNSVIRAQTNLVLVRVIIRDEQGNPVAGLSQNDFQLFDEKKQQTIAYFAAENPQPPPNSFAPSANPGVPAALAVVQPPTRPQRFTAFFFDDYHMGFSDLVQVRNAALEIAAKNLETGTRVAVFSASGKPFLDFTNDRRKIQDALSQIHFDRRFQPNECPKMPPYFAQQVLDDISNLSGAVGGSAPSLPGGVSGGGDPVSLDDPIILSEQLAQMQQCPAVGMYPGDDLKNRARNVVLLNHQGVEVTLLSLERLIQRMTEPPGNERTIALVSDGFFDKTDESLLDRLMDRALRANVVVNALDARGLYAQPPGGDLALRPSPPQVQRRLDRLESTSKQTDSDALNEVSEGTGGVLVENTNDMKAGIAKISEIETPAYVLGFAPENLKSDGRFHSIKVKVVSQSHYSLQARRGFFAPDGKEATANAAESQQEKMMQAVFAQESVTDLPIRVSVALKTAGAQNPSLAVTVDADMHSARFSKKEGHNSDDMTLIVALFDSDGNYVTARQQVTKLRLTDTEFQELKRTGGETTLDLSVKPGVYTVRTVLLETSSNRLGAISESIRIP